MKSYVEAIQFKATEQWFIYANEILKGELSTSSTELYCYVQSFRLWMKSYGATIQDTVLSLTGDFGQVKLEQYRKRNNFLL